MVAVRSGIAVVRQGEPCPGLWIVETGLLLQRATSPEGRELTFDVLGPGDPVGEPGGACAPATVRSLRYSRLLPVEASAAADLLAARARRAAALACDLAWLDAAARVERRLRDLAERFGRPALGGTLLMLPLTQEDLGGLAGTTRESANRALRSLEARGRVRVVGRGRYLVRALPPPEGA
jgi:CRP/FNR family transcriptional regulator